MLKIVGQLLSSQGIGLIVYRSKELIYNNGANINQEFFDNREGLNVSEYKDDSLSMYLINPNPNQGLALYESIKSLINNSGNKLYEVDEEGNPLGEIIHSSDIGTLRGASSIAIRTGVPQSGIKYRMLEGDTWKWYSNSLVKGKGIGKKVLAFGADLSSIIAHSRKVKKLQGILDSLLKNAPIQIYVIDVSGIIYIWEGKKLFLVEEEILGQQYTEALREYPEIVEELRGAMMGASEEVHWGVVYKNRHLESKVNPIYQDGEITGIIGVIVDNTEIISRASELKQFAYIASHDLQEPVRMIHNYLQLLNHYFGEASDPKAKKYINNILNSANKLKNLIEDLLNYSRVSSKLDIQRVSLRHTIQEVTSNLGVFIKEKDARINYPPFTMYVRADATHMIQLFQNLIQNGIKFSSSPVIDIGWQKEDQWVVISIKDNGIGIAPEHHEYIFLPFKRLNNELPGTGMGLPICKKVVEANGGVIFVDSDIERGTTFYIKLEEAL